VLNTQLSDINFDKRGQAFFIALLKKSGSFECQKCKNERLTPPESANPES
jgi:hypothetical protein